jgi:hypothetical protein
MENSSLLKYGLFGTATLAAVFCIDGIFADAEAALPTPDELDVSFDTLEKLLEQAHSPYAPAEAILRLQPIINYRIADLDKLIAAMEQVAPSNAKELIALREARAELSIIDTRIDELVPRLQALDSVRNGYGVNLIASKGAQLIPQFDVDALEKVHAHTVSMYNGVEYGEVLVLDEKGNLVERKFSALVKIGNTSDKISPILAHRLMEVFGKTDSGASGWTMSSGAFEDPSAHKMIDGKPASDHIAPPHALDTVDIIPSGNAGLDPKRLGEFALAARDDETIRFFQIETGKNMTVAEMKEQLTKEWKGKISDSDLNYLLSKVVSNGSGVHIHVEFNCPTHHTAYVPPTTTVASR